MFGGGGMNPRKMQQMMEQMGIDVDELDATEVVISLEDGSELVFSDPDVTKMDARGQETYQVLGDPSEREAAAGAVEGGDAEDADGDEDSGEAGIPQGDVDIVVQRAGVPEDDAREALEAADGDLAAAIERLE
jgi:nascent polypeptide-associated complex subunit alpha